MSHSFYYNLKQTPDYTPVDRWEALAGASDQAEYGAAAAENSYSAPVPPPVTEVKIFQIFPKYFQIFKEYFKTYKEYYRIF